MKKLLKVKLLNNKAKLPSRSTKSCAGLDLYATEDTIIPPMWMDVEGHVQAGQATLHTGIAIELPENTIGKLASRSGLAINHNIEVGAGWIDPDYRGEIIVLLRNFGTDAYCIKIGDRFAQLVVLNTPLIEVITAQNLTKTNRNIGGLGSSGYYYSGN
jgi:deoxyuridine 5'-triphosphate nucleotidohydrolase